MTPDDEVNRLVLALLLCVVTCIYVIWGVPDGHCARDCACRLPTRRHK